MKENHSAYQEHAAFEALIHGPPSSKGTERWAMSRGCPDAVSKTPPANW